MNPIRVIRAAAALTQIELADVAKTSQPTLAAYEGGAKSPTWRTIERVAGSVGLACYPYVGAPFTRDQRRSLALHIAISAELRRRGPEVVAAARTNVATMRSANPHAWPLIREWERILEGTVDQIVGAMLDPSEHGRALRQLTPFAGVLTMAQRTSVYASFRSAA